MADWYDVAVEVLLQLAESNPTLEREIRMAVHLIEGNPRIGAFIQETRHVYRDPQGRFRIGYNFHPKGTLEVVVINVLT
ncbi:MAG: hypothetical protein VX610_01650 [SAR324 cluster bacterium]|nr:hypothetical protein [SAR324 cluster bacterium]